MILEWLMDRFGWEAVWCPHAGYQRRTWPLRWFVGTWTGPDGDLLCVAPAEGKEEAEALLSPPGRTALHAAILSAAKLVRTRKRNALRPR